MINIFGYTDYRHYLKDYFMERKKREPLFSHRWLARRLELSTSNFILLVMQGKRNLSNSLCIKISEVFAHTQSEATYFEEMVNFLQAKTNKEKNLYFSRMIALRKSFKIDTIEEWQYEYYSNWYNPAIRELITSGAFDGDTKELARLLIPPITKNEVEKSINLLLKLGLIIKQGDSYIQSSPFITTGPEVQSLAVVNFHKKMGELAVESLERVPKEERNITASTIFITEDMFDTMRKKIDDFRKELLALASSDCKGERVYQVNFQVFPVSGPYKKGEKQV